MTAQRWAVVGTGAISRTVVPDLMACSGAEVTVVVSRDAARARTFADELGIPGASGDYGALLADDAVDALYLATPIATHAELTRQALLAGKHVLVEKPMAISAAEAEELFALAAERGVFLMEAMWMKFNPAFRRLHEEIAAGRIGEPRALRAGFGIPWPRDEASRWDVARGGGALLDQGIYPVTLAHSVFGAPSSVQAAGVLQDDGLDLAEHVTLEFGDGRFAQCASSLTEFVDCSAAVSGSRGWIVLPAPFWAGTTVSIHADSFQKILREPDVASYPQEGSGYVPMMREVVDAVAGGALEHPVHPAADTVAVFRTLDEIRRQLTPSPTATPREDCA